MALSEHQCKTVHRYLEQAEQQGVGAQTPVTKVVAASVGRQVQKRPEPPPSEAGRVLEACRARISDWLAGERPLRLVRIHELLEREGIAVGYTTLRRYVKRELGWGHRTPTVRLADPPPGQEAQLDFGLMGLVPSEDGKSRRLWVLIVMLPSSRYLFVYPTYTQTVADVCAGLDAAWCFFGGMPKYRIRSAARVADRREAGM